ncbi:MAG: ParB/RepB/Spo0J family partition protein [Rhizobiaceae bacterium]|nr:ParB/RepB/Spo0J family partition protein [Rhizobiaceae bacterium]
MTTKLVSLPLKGLKLSKLNVRQQPPSDDDMAELTASIRENGLKQNLVVHKVGREYHVHAGGRRLQVLRAMQDAGDLPKDHKVPCLVESKEQAEETSLIENFHRLKMLPIDEFLAFDRLLQKGNTIEAVANRFGVTARFVEGRMRLARLSPKILQAFRDHQIDLDQVKAYTITDDHARQEEVFEREGRYGSVWSIKGALSKTKISGSSSVARFIDHAAYEAAGGTITRDLFSDDDSVLYDDPALAERLAMEKLQAKADELKAEWKWADVMLSIPYDAFRSYGRVYPEPLPLSDDLAAEQEKIHSRIRELDEVGEDEWSEELDQEYNKLHERDEEISDSQEVTFTAHQKVIAGVIVSIDSNRGEFRIEYGLVHPDDKPKAEDRPASPMDSPSVDPATSARSAAGETISVIDDIRAIRHQVLRAHLSADFNTAFDALLYSMVVGIFGHSYSNQPISTSVKAAEVHRSKEVLTGTIGESMLEQLKKKLNLEWLNLDQPHDFNAMSALEPRAKQDLFAWCAAYGVNQSLSTDPHANPVLEVIGKRMDVDVASCWRPNAEHYWKRVKKGYALKVAGEQISSTWSDDHAKDKKAQIAEAMEHAFGDDPQKTAGLTADIASHTSIWLPDGMAFTGEYIERKNHHLSYGSTYDDDIDPDADMELDAEAGDDSMADDLTDNDPDSLEDDGAHDDDDDGDIPAFLKDAAE